MKKLLFAACAALGLAACHFDSAATNTAPAHYANMTVVDEQAALTAELAYKSWRLAVETGVQSGLIKGPTAAKVADIDNRLYAALQVVEQAYATGNSADINSAAERFNTLLSSGYKTLGGK